MRQLLRPCPAVLLTAALLSGCGAAGHTVTRVAAAAPVTAVPAAASAQAARLGHAACAAWTKVPTVHDLPAVQALRATAQRSATAAAKLDPRWSPLAEDLTDLGALEAAYAKADVYHAFPLVPKLDALRKRIPTRC
jgi:hypothetical protein